jgi:hypothetical protein
MMSEIENPKLSIGQLNELEDLVKNNKAKAEDYEKLDNYLSFLGIDNFILGKLKESRIDSYEDFIFERKNNNGKLSLLVGSVLGVISTLKKHISGKL